MAYEHDLTHFRLGLWRCLCQRPDSTGTILGPVAHPPHGRCSLVVRDRVERGEDLAAVHVLELELGELNVVDMIRNDHVGSCPTCLCHLLDELFRCAAGEVDIVYWHSAGRDCGSNCC